METLRKRFEKETGQSAGMQNPIGDKDDFLPSKAYTYWLEKQIDELLNLVRIQPERNPRFFCPPGCKGAVISCTTEASAGNENYKPI